MPDAVRAMLERWVEAMDTGDWDAIGAMVHPDFVEEMPQTRERTRGWDNMRAILQGFPDSRGGPPAEAEDITVVEPAQQWAMSPSFTLVQVQGDFDRYTVTMRAHYPDDTYWHGIFLVRLRDGKLWRITSYYAPEMPAPEWRAPFVERMDEIAT